MSARIRVERHTLGIVIWVGGALGAGAVADFYAALLEVESGAESALGRNLQIIFDLEGLSGLDESGIGMMLLVLQVCGKRRAWVRNVPHQVAGVLGPYRRFLRDAEELSLRAHSTAGTKGTPDSRCPGDPPEE